MPNRILKESICRSEDIEELSPMEEITFYRLIVSCDDFGRFDARPKIVKGHCFPLKNISDKEIRDILKRLASAGLLILYEADGKPILQMVSWKKHQTARAHNSKYPEYDSSCMHLYSDDFMCEQMKSNKNRKKRKLKTASRTACNYITAKYWRRVANTKERYRRMVSSISCYRCNAVS